MRKSILFLILTISVGLIGTYFSNALDQQDDQTCIAKIVSDVQQLDKELSRLLIHIAENEIELHGLDDLWNEKGIALMIYDEDQVVQWTTNAVPFQVTFDPRIPPDQGIVKLKNAWYLCRSIAVDGQLLVAYALLSTEYNFENRYISHSWGPSIQGNHHFSFTHATDHAFPVQLSDGMATVGIRHSLPDNDPMLTWNAMIWLVFLALLLLTLWHSANWISVSVSEATGHVFFISLTVVLRALMLWWELPKALYDLELFGPTPHATSDLIPSLGDLMFHLLVMSTVLIRLRKLTVQPDNKWFQGLIGVVLPVLMIWPVDALFEILVINSSFSLDLNSLFTLSPYSFVGLFTTFFILFNFYLAHHILSRSVMAENRSFRFIVPLTLASGLALFLLLGADANAGIISMVGASALAFLMLSRSWRPKGIELEFSTPTILAFSLIGCVMLTGSVAENERTSRMAMARNIDKQQDPITEFLFNQLATELRSDRKLRLALTASPFSSSEVLSYIHSKLSYDHWNRYLSVVDVFNEDGSLLVSDQEHTGLNYSEWQNAFENARPTISDQLKYVDGSVGSAGYLARVELEGKRGQQSIVLFVRLTPERTDNNIGFTDLFVDEEISSLKALEGYSYALYEQGELRQRHGSFPYSLSSKEYEHLGGEDPFVINDGFSHLVSKPMEGRIVVVSRSSSLVLSYLTTFSYLFLLYLLCSLLLSLASGTFLQHPLERQSFRNRIKLAMGSVSFISLLFIGLLTVLYVINGYHSRNVEMISEKSRSVLIELENKLKDREELGDADRVLIAGLLTKFSKVFFTDINLYTIDGRLLATSRPRLYDEGLLAEVIDPRAYTEMRFSQRSSFIQEETIGNLNYLTAYVPFRNERGEVIAFMSLPYFARQYGLQQEIFSLLAALINIYVFLILLSVVLAIIISNRITEPLRFIRESLRNLKLDQTNRAIVWTSKDEIGELVEEYNRTLNELVQSAELLARSERESAWREMAKQVAHEIKNPLTPMKLSIQMLQRSKNDGVDDLDERIDRMAKTLIEQIDTLSNIATEFSSFAQMPGSNMESVDLRELLESAVSLHQGSEAEVLLQLPTDGPSIILADRDQMLRVFNNLIKNGIQAIPEDRRPQIVIALKHQDQHWLVSVSDNGTGIAEELREQIFAPNFTTKTSGMGLGLAMVKNIVELAKGRIWFETDLGKGSTFYISFPAV